MVVSPRAAVIFKAGQVAAASLNAEREKMKAVRFHKTGGPEVLVYEDVPDPTPKDGEVLIKVEAAGINFADVMRRRGDNYPEPSPPPFITRRRRVRAVHQRPRGNRRTAAAWR